MLLTVAEDSDTSWARSILEEAKKPEGNLARGLVREAFRKRHRARNPEATRVVNELMDVELHSIFNPSLSEGAV